MRVQRITRDFLVIFMVLAIGPVLTGCELARNYTKMDRPLELEREDYRRALAPRPAPDAEPEAPIPDLESYVDSEISTTRPMPLITISVNQTVALREILYEIAEQAEINLELDPNITGSIIFTAREKPVDEVIERIADLAGLRYKFEDDFLRVEVDRPYQKIYKVRYLNGQRTISTSVSYQLDVSAEAGDAGGGESEGGTSVDISQDIQADVWGEIEDNIRAILQITDQNVALRTTNTPTTQILAPIAQPPAVPAADGTATTGATAPDGGQATTQPAAAPVTPVQQQTPQIQVTSVAPPDDIQSQPAILTVNRQAGVLSVFATEKQHEEVAEYLHEVRRNVTTQILIEARILEVALNDQFVTGIDWGTFNLFQGNLNASGSFVQGVLDPSLNAGTNFELNLNTNDVDLAVDAISRFGTVRALSSPRLTTLNNTTAVINITDNEVFFDCEGGDTTFDGNGNTVTTAPECDPISVPLGIIMSVQPAVDLDTDEITLSLRPVVTSSNSTATDPAFVTNIIPEVSQKILDSIVKIKSGRTLVMGGLMEDSNTVTEEGVPLLSDIPLLGLAFKGKQDGVQKTELVIFLTATIIPSEYTHEYDRELYREHGSDRRPLRL